MKYRMPHEDREHEWNMDRGCLVTRAFMGNLEEPLNSEHFEVGVVTGCISDEVVRVKFPSESTSMEYATNELEAVVIDDE